MIIVEGCDGTGKTTLINQLHERYGLPIAPRVVSKDAEAMVNLKEWVEMQNARGFQRVLFDRHRLISEPIYGPILRAEQDQAFLNHNWLSWQMIEFYKIKPRFVYCIPPLSVVKANIENDPDNVVVKDKIEAIYAAYVARAAVDLGNRAANVTVWDYTRDGKEEDPLSHFDTYFQYHLGIYPFDTKDN